MPIARRVERRGRDSATRPTRRTRARRGGFRRTRTRETTVDWRVARDEDGDADDDGDDEGDDANGTTRATGGGATRARAASGGVSKSSLDEGYNCVVREDGVMVAEGDIPSGTYQVSAWWAGARNDGKGNAPRCDSERQRGCEVRCELTGEGELVCEGIESGTYVVVNVADLDEACAVTFDGESIECEGAGEPLVSDTGDLDLKDSSQHGIRMGG